MVMIWNKDQQKLILIKPLDSLFSSGLVWLYHWHLTVQFVYRIWLLFMHVCTYRLIELWTRMATSPVVWAASASVPHSSPPSVFRTQSDCVRVVYFVIDISSGCHSETKRQLAIRYLQSRLTLVDLVQDLTCHLLLLRDLEVLRVVFSRISLLWDM